MTHPCQDIPRFDLWSEPWIEMERTDGQHERLGIEETLLHAHEFQAICEPSPLVVVSIHRMLVAVLQAALAPRKTTDLKRLWQLGKFPPEAITGFATRYAGRFDLFSADAPFLQSADLALQPAKGDSLKTVAYLSMEVPSGTAVTHYRHGSEGSYLFCPACAAGGLVSIPPFATSGGAGIKPSINGVPPIYVMPGGKTLFQSLTASLTLPEYQPLVAAQESDTPWWEHQPIVPRSAEVYQVGYLHSLTFPARRVRLHPEAAAVPCTRCGRSGRWGVRTMVFEMGESRPKNAAAWFDPYAAYIVPQGGKKPPRPVRPIAGRALWREYGALFLPHRLSHQRKADTIRPALLSQMAEKDVGFEPDHYPFRCVGLRTDMKAKVFEWLDVGFDVPSRLLNDPDAGDEIEDAIEFASECNDILRDVFRAAFRGRQGAPIRHGTLEARMHDAYWSALAEPFRAFVAAFSTACAEERSKELESWATQVVKEGQTAFVRAADDLGDDAVSLRQRVQGEQRCRYRLLNIRQKRYPREKGDVNG